jgi:type II secretory pathway pseudopilin PulG
MTRSRRQAALRRFRPAHNGELGLTLIEIVVAMGILAAVAVTFLVSMTTSSKAVMVSQKSVAAESLAKSELEYVKSVAYHSANTTWSYQLPTSHPDWDPTHSLPDGYGGYSVQVDADKVSGQTWDLGIQKITVTVTYKGEPAFTLVGYKVKP